MKKGRGVSRPVLSACAAFVSFFCPLCWQCVFTRLVDQATSSHGSAQGIAAAVNSGSKEGGNSFVGGAPLKETALVPVGFLQPGAHGTGAGAPGMLKEAAFDGNSVGAGSPRIWATVLVEATGAATAVLTGVETNIASSTSIRSAKKQSGFFMRCPL